MKKTTLYIAGPMTGLPDLNFPAFHLAARQLRAMGFEVINPAEINPDQHMSWQACMRTDIAALVFCDGIHLLAGWQASKGATLEHHIAERLGLRITYPVGEEAPQPPGVVAYHYKFPSKWCGDVWSVSLCVPEIATEWHPLGRITAQVNHLADASNIAKATDWSAA